MSRPLTPPPPTRLTPARAEALRITTLTQTWNPGATSQLAARFGPPFPASDWRIPQVMPPTDPVAAAARSFLAAQQRLATPAAPEAATGQPCPRARAADLDPAGRPFR